MLHVLPAGDVFPKNTLSASFALRISEASSTAHLDKVERGYENMDHFTVNFMKEGKALRTIDFMQGEGTEWVAVHRAFVSV